MTAPCTTCQGRCPTPYACELPIQPSAAEIRRERWQRLVIRIRYIAAVCAGIVIAIAVSVLAGHFNH